MLDYAEEEVSTVFVGGLPADATQRELDNLCRFIPGFLNSKVDYKRGMTLFARFDSPKSAHLAISLLHNQMFDRYSPGEPLRVVMAKSNMRSGDGDMMKGPPMRGTGHAPPPLPSPASLGWRQGGGQGGGFGPGPSASVAYHGGGGHPASAAPTSRKRSRIPENPANVDTVACVGAHEAGFDDRALEDYFSGLQGFLAFKPNPRMGGGFAKFETAGLASQAVAEATDQGIPAAIAKSSMSSTNVSGSGSAAAAAAAQLEPPNGGGYWPQQVQVEQHAKAPEGRSKRLRYAENPEEVDTLAIVGAAEAGIDDSSLQEFFAQLEGFIAFKPNPRMGGGFVKFGSAALANQAAGVAQDQGIPAAIAKSSMSAVN